MKTFWLQLERWWLGANCAALKGGALAVKAFLGVSGAHAAGLQVPELTLSQVGAAFTFGFLSSLADYLAANPMPSMPKAQPDLQ